MSKTKRTYRQYPPEFKQEAVSLVLEQDYPVSEVAKFLSAEASAACYSLIETAKANNLDPQAYIKHILDHIAVADTLEKLEALLPWNVELG